MRRLLFTFAVALIATTVHAQEPWDFSRIAPSPSPLAVPGLPTLPELPGLPSITVPAPRSGSDFDALSGNSIRWRRDSAGNTRVNGMNLYTGSTWKHTIEPDGSMSGWDSKLNPWRFNSRTKTYTNFGTGEMCVGSGAARYCF